MILPIYTLPEISFVGGESQVFLFNMRTMSGNDFDGTNCSVGFALIHYANKNSAPLLVKEAELKIGDNGFLNIASIHLSPSDTVGLYGRFVYQITINDSEGFTEIPGQGIINITRNIHPLFIS